MNLQNYIAVQGLLDEQQLARHSPSPSLNDHKKSFDSIYSPASKTDAFHSQNHPNVEFTPQVKNFDFAKVATTANCVQSQHTTSMKPVMKTPSKNEPIKLTQRE